MIDFLIDMGYIPPGKSWMIRLGVLDLLYGYKNMINFLSNQKENCTDLEDLLHASIAWDKGEPIETESGTLCRCLQFASWQRKEDRKFIKRGTLKNRKICNDPNIIYWSLEKLLTLESSQWTTAALLCGNREVLKNMPPRVKLTYEAREHWESRRAQKMCWQEKYDFTLAGQAVHYLKLLVGNNAVFEPKDAEDYCFARAFGYITTAEGKKRWPQLAEHESNRFVEMDKVLIAAANGEKIISDDHRIVQAMAMWSKVNNYPLEFSNPGAVKKSWPQFWKFLEEVSTTV